MRSTILASCFMYFDESCSSTKYLKKSTHKAAKHKADVIICRSVLKTGMFQSLPRHIKD